MLGLVGAAGPLEVIDAMGKLKGKEEVNQFVQKRLKAADRGEWFGGTGGGGTGWKAGCGGVDAMIQHGVLALPLDLTATAWEACQL